MIKLLMSLLALIFITAGVLAAINLAFGLSSALTTTDSLVAIANATTIAYWHAQSASD